MIEIKFEEFRRLLCLELSYNLLYTAEYTSQPKKLQNLGGTELHVFAEGGGTGTSE